MEYEPRKISKQIISFAVNSQQFPEFVYEVIIKKV